MSNGYSFEYDGFGGVRVREGGDWADEAPEEHAVPITINGRTQYIDPRQALEEQHREERRPGVRASIDGQRYLLDDPTFDLAAEQAREERDSFGVRWSYDRGMASHQLDHDDPDLAPDPVERMRIRIESGGMEFTLEPDEAELYAAEAMERQTQKRYAGEFDTVEDMERAYLALEAQLNG